MLHVDGGVVISKNDQFSSFKFNDDDENMMGAISDYYYYQRSGGNIGNFSVYMSENWAYSSM